MKRIDLRLDDETARLVDELADREGMDVSCLVHKAIRELVHDWDRIVHAEPDTVGSRLVNRARGTATSGLTTNEIMRMTRGED